MWFFIAIICTYSLLIFYFTYIWNRKETILTNQDYLKVSVIIPFRNEATNLHTLINSFKLIGYPDHLVEFIFVDDHSTDNSFNTLKRLLVKFPFAYVILSLKNGNHGKKQAIIEAVAHSNGSIIICTDADCQVSPNWIKLMQNPFHIPEIHMVSGNVVFKANSYLEKLFQMEFAPLIGVGGVSIKLGNPVMANGANLAFRKSTFLELDVFKYNIHIPTGDDVFLLQKIASHYPNGVVFQKESIVTTKAPQSFSEFYQQRIRWASKWKASSENKNKLPAFGVWLFHFLFLIGFIGLVVESNYKVAAILFFIKLSSEYLFIKTVLKSQKQRFNILIFMILQFLYSLYVVIFGIMSNFSVYEWKGRFYGKHER